MNKSFLATAVATNMLCLALQAHAEIASTAGVTVSAGSGVYSADSDRELHHHNQYNAGIGYRFGENWETELTYMQSKHDGKGALDGATAKLKNLRLDGTYYLSNGRFQPYLSAGVGRHTYDYSSIEDNKDYETEVNVGAGIKYFATPSIFLRADARLFDARGGVVDSAVSFGVGYMFGQSPMAVAVVDGDDDADGVPNSIDQCPDTQPGVVVDSNGCDIPPEPVVMSLDVEFEFASSTMMHEFDDEVAELGELLQAHPEANVTLVGHTDNAGAAAFNQTLSEKRAQSVADYLTQNYDIDSSRMAVSGQGESDPEVANDTQENRQVNRRVVATVNTES